MDITELRQYFKKQLKGHYPPDEIKGLFQLLVTDLLHINKIELLLEAKKEISKNDLIKVHKAIAKLKNKMPVQYILGYCHFYGMRLKVNSNVLIPRPETEELVDWILKEHLLDKNLRIIDIGAGSGCIALALKRNIPSSEVTAIDNSEKALAIAKYNAYKLGLNVRFINADILKMPFRIKNYEYDIIASNPPYIALSERNELPENVLKEPNEALFVPDEDPLLYYRAIAQFVCKPSQANGTLGGGRNKQIYFEIHEDRAGAISSMLSSMGFENIVIRKDINGKNRMISCNMLAAKD